MLQHKRNFYCLKHIDTIEEIIILSNIIHTRIKKVVSLNDIIFHNRQYICNTVL